MSSGGLTWIFFPASIIGSGTIDGDRLPALSSSKKGAAPATGTPGGKFLKDDNTWSAVAPEYTLLVDSASIAGDVKSATTHYMWLSTAQSAPTLTLSNVVANSIVDITVKKTIAGTCSITLAGTGLTWKGYNNAGYGSSPVVVLSGAANDYFTLSIKFDKDKCGIIALGSNAN